MNTDQRAQRRSLCGFVTPAFVLQSRLNPAQTFGTAGATVYGRNSTRLSRTSHRLCL
jgi:hypothetical protein